MTDHGPPLSGVRPPTVTTTDSRPPLFGVRPLTTNDNRPPLSGVRLPTTTDSRPPLFGVRPLTTNDSWWRIRTLISLSCLPSSNCRKKIGVYNSSLWSSKQSCPCCSVRGQTSVIRPLLPLNIPYPREVWLEVYHMTCAADVVNTDIGLGNAHIINLSRKNHPRRRRRFWLRTRK